MRTGFWLMVAAYVGWATRRCHQHPLSDDKIVGGTVVTDIRSAPHATSLQIQNVSSGKWFKFCGGSIFSPLYVITACHCVTQVNPNSGSLIDLVNYIPLKIWRFVAGTASLVNFSPSYQSRHPQSIQHHPRCELKSGNDTWLMFDLAVAKMSEPFTINEFVKPVKIFSLDRDEFELQLDQMMIGWVPPDCLVAGWGSTKRQSLENYILESVMSTTEPTSNNQTGEDGNQLKIVHLDPMYEGECLVRLVMAFASIFGKVNYHTVMFYGRLLHHQICAASYKGDQAVCKGDSGSGLLCDGHLIGITSWGLGCGSLVPDVFQSLPVVIDWFKYEVCAVQSCSDAQNLPRLCNRLYDPGVLQSYLENCTTEANILNTKASNKLPTTQASRASQPSSEDSLPSLNSISALTLDLKCLLCVYLTIKLAMIAEYIKYLFGSP